MVLENKKFFSYVYLLEALLLPVAKIVNTPKSMLPAILKALTSLIASCLLGDHAILQLLSVTDDLCFTYLSINALLV